MNEPIVTDQSQTSPLDMSEEEALCLFRDVEEDLPAIRSIAEYDHALKELVAINAALGSSQRATKVGTAMRALKESRGEIEKRDIDSQRSRESARIAKLEQRAPKCFRGHPLEIVRRKDGNLFWGCTTFRDSHCNGGRSLTESERRFLDS